MASKYFIQLYRKYYYKQLLNTLSIYILYDYSVSRIYLDVPKWTMQKHEFHFSLCLSPIIK